MFQLIGTGEAARILNCSVENVRALERAGKLRAERLPSSGHRVFKASEVKRLATERQRQGKAKGVAAAVN
jgi:excisionase family DNA binding protein